MRLAYCNEGISISETFIYDLAVSLSLKADITFIAGKPRTEVLPFKYDNLKYVKRYSFIEKKLNSILSREYRFKSNLSYAEKKIKQLKDYDAAYIDYGTTAVLFDKELTQKNIPYIVHFHGHDITSALNNTWYKKHLKKVLSNAYAIIAPSNHTKRLLVLEGCAEEKISVIRYGFESEKIIPLSWNDRHENLPSLIFVGRLTKKKNPLALIRAFNIVARANKDVILTIIGDGELMPDCKRLVTDLNLENSVSFYGAISRDKIFPILNKHWIYVQHSVTSFNGDQEGFPLSLAEAALHELPIVSTLHNGITENVVDGVTGFLVQEYDYEAMAEKIIHLIKHPDLIENMGKAGRVRMKEMCKLEERTDKIYSILAAAANSKK